MKNMNQSLKEGGVLNPQQIEKDFSNTLFEFLEYGALRDFYLIVLKGPMN